jgi:hypothetical protein
MSPGEQTPAQCFWCKRREAVLIHSFILKRKRSSASAFAPQGKAMRLLFRPCGDFDFTNYSDCSD